MSFFLIKYTLFIHFKVVKRTIIFRTVRCNHCGNVGFLDSDRRANVALTKAKYASFWGGLFWELDPWKIKYTAFLFKYFFPHELPLDPGRRNDKKMVMMST